MTFFVDKHKIALQKKLIGRIDHSNAPMPRKTDFQFMNYMIMYRSKSPSATSSVSYVDQSFD